MRTQLHNAVIDGINGDERSDSNWRKGSYQRLCQPVESIACKAFWRLAITNSPTPLRAIMLMFCTARTLPDDGILCAETGPSRAQRNGRSSRRLKG